MSIEKELNKIKKGEISDVYVLKGDQDFLIKKLLAALKESLFETEDEEFNYIRFDMNDTSISTAIEEAQSVPFFGDHKLVVIDHPYFFTAEKKKTEFEQNLDELTAYLTAPTEQTTLVFIHSYEKFDERKKIVKLLKKNSTIIDVSPLSEKATENYLAQLIADEGYGIEGSAFKELLFLCDYDISKLMNEVQKLFLYSAETKQISLDEVITLVPKSLEHNIFDMIKYIMTGQKEFALRLYQDLLKQGEDTIKINAILISQFRLFLQVKMLQSIQYQQSNMVDVLKIHPYRIKLAYQEVRNIPLSKIGASFDQLIENDYLIKTGQMDKDLLFEFFVLKV
ncbi:DNA polymerase III subunit delta [Vagococcus silagei]|uniref:DNA polymerase III subunit delta n=2 Tax=Vagococcus silagei TaxID=2508885 RepID=A0A4S3B5I9_9ENTE|nr:DNA polymerase III subunit delta [Vagococcus silagei]